LPPRMLSKSKYLYGIQCPRYLWIACNRPELIPQPDPVTQHRFDQGHLVGQMAKELFPGGIDIPTQNFTTNLDLTQTLLNERKPLFEAGFAANRLYSRVDALVPAGDGRWDIVEVKSKTRVEEINLHDVSFQRLCCRSAGLEIDRCYLAIIDKEYVKQGDIDPQQFFVLEDITEAVEDISRGIEDRVAAMLEIITRTETPEICIGPQCDNPYPCPLKEVDCWQGLPEHNVFTLVRGGRKSKDLYDGGMIEICQIPPYFDLNDRQQIQVECVTAGRIHIDKAAIRAFLDRINYPLYYLDFETINPAVPLYDYSRPFQQVPFQFSLHVQASPGAEAEHFWYLADGPGDPRPELASQLRHRIGTEGSVMVYYQPFEKTILEELAVALPEYREWVRMVTGRMADLLVPFRNFDYYHPGQMGSASLKSILPALTGKGYEDMAISNGGDASLKFLDITFAQTTPETRQQVRRDLLEYCGLDTLGMVRIVEKLQQLAS